MTVLTRFCLWGSPGQADHLNELCDTFIASLLGEQGLVPSDQAGRPTVPGVVSRLFELDSTAAVDRCRSALRRNAPFQNALIELDSRLGSSRGLPARYSLETYSAPAGEGQSSRVGLGYHQGLWHTLSVEDGLPSPVVLDMLQDEDGFLWLATRGGGLVRYGGARFLALGPTDGLPSDSVRALLRDRQGALWLSVCPWNVHQRGPGFGVIRYDGTNMEGYTQADGLASDTVSSIVVDDAGNLWFGTDSGLSQFDGQAFSTYTSSDGLVGNDVQAIIYDHQGRLWIGANGGVSVLEDGQIHSPPVPPELASREVSALALDGEGHVWAGAFGGGIARFDGEDFEHLQPDPGDVGRLVTTLRHRADGDLWLGSLGAGAAHWTGDAFETFTSADGLANGHVLTTLEDREGQVWFGTLGGGICRYDGARFTHITADTGLASSLVFDILEDRCGDVWFGHAEGVTRFDGTAYHQYPAVSGKPGSTVNCLLEARSGDLWFGTRSGLVRYDGDAFTTYTTADGLASNSIFCMLEDRRGHLWLGSGWMGKYLTRYDGASFTVYTTDDGLTGEAVWSMAEDRAGNLWFGTQTGVSRYDGQTFTSFVEADGLPITWVASILVDADGNLWFGEGRSWRGGLVRYDGREFTYFAADVIPAHQLLDMLQDERGHLWLGTRGGGVTRFDGQVFQSRSRRSGLMDDAVQALLMDRHGNLWIGTEGGVTRYRPTSTPPRLRLTDAIADRRLGPVRELQVRASQGYIAFEFEGCSLTTPLQSMAYRHMLEGHDDGWLTTRSGRVEYQDLPLGKYTFRVQAVDLDLNYSETAIVTVRVEPDPRIQALVGALSGAPEQFVGDSPALQRLEDQLAQVAPTDLTVLITGETGTGKGLAARIVHALSPRQAQPFITVSCGAIPDGLVESELFGHEKGAFTGAASRQLGKLEVAGTGTLFLDEIGDLAPAAQVKLLQFLQERTFERVGGAETLTVAARIVAATNRDLRAMVDAGTFREDLYYRLQVFAVELPPLRERPVDIPQLATFFMVQMASHLSKGVGGIAPGALARLQSYDWPGNVRELEHAMHRAVVVCRGAQIEAGDIPLTDDPGRGLTPPLPLTLEEVELQHITAVLEQCEWVVKGPDGAAARLGLNPSTLRSRMRKLGVERP